MFSKKKVFFWARLNLQPSAKVYSSVESIEGKHWILEGTDWILFFYSIFLWRIIKQIRAGVNFINILRTNFLYKRHFGSFFYVHVTREKLPKQRSYEKFVRKMLMKVTTECRRSGAESIDKNDEQFTNCFSFIHILSNILLFRVG